VPSLRFPEFSGEWEGCTISDFGKIITGMTPSTHISEYYINGSNLWASPADLGKSKYINNTSTKLSNKGFAKTRHIPMGAILITCIGSTIGKMGMATTEMSTNQQINSLVVNSNYDRDFVYYAIEHRFPHYLKDVATQAVPILSKSNFEKLKNYSTSKPEQQKIGKFLDLLEQKINIQSRIIEDLKKLRSAIINRVLFSDEWTKFSLSQILIERNERSTNNNQYEVLSSTINGIYIQKEYFNKDIASENNVGYKIVRRGDIVLSPQNLWMGNINYNDTFDVGIVSPSYKVYTIREGFDKMFIATLLKTHRALYGYLLASEQGASIVRRNLNVDAFMELSFGVPNIIIQQKLSTGLKGVDKKLNNEVRAKKCYEILRLYLLSAMFI